MTAWGLGTSMQCLLDVKHKIQEENVSFPNKTFFLHCHLTCLVDVDTRAAFLSPHQLLVWDFLQRMRVVVMYCLNSMPLEILIMLILLELEFMLDTWIQENCHDFYLKALTVTPPIAKFGPQLLSNLFTWIFFFKSASKQLLYARYTRMYKIHKSTSSGEALKPLLFAQMLPSWPAMAAAVTIPLAISCTRVEFIKRVRHPDGDQL